MASPIPVLPGQKLRLRDILERHSLPSELTVLDGFDGPTEGESIDAGTRIRIHFVLQEEAISAVKESDSREFRIPMNCSVLFEPLPDNPDLDDVVYKRARDVVNAKLDPGPVYATVALLLPDGLQVDEDDLLEFGKVGRDQGGNVVVHAKRNYFNHVTQKDGEELYKIPADLEANFVTTAPSKERYLICELIRKCPLPARVRMHPRRKASTGALKFIPDPPFKVLLKRAVKRYYAVASEVKSGRVFAMEVLDQSPLRFKEDEKSGRKEEEDIYFLLYGLVNFGAISKIGIPEADMTAFRETLPMVRVPLRVEESQELITSNCGALNYQLIKQSDYNRVGIFFHPVLGAAELQRRTHSDGRPKTMETGETRFYDAFPIAEGDCVVKQRNWKVSFHLDRLQLETAIESASSKLSDISSRRFEHLEEVGKPTEAPAPPVPPRQPVVEERRRIPSVHRSQSLNTSSSSPSSVAKLIKKGISKGISKGITFFRGHSEEKTSTSPPIPQRDIPPIPSPSSPLSPRPPALKPKPLISRKSFDASYVAMTLQTTPFDKELKDLKELLQSEESKQKRLRYQLKVQDEKLKKDEKKPSYNDENPIESIASFSNEEVLHLLKGLGCQEYSDAFKEFDVEGYWLVECDVGAFRDLGMRPFHATKLYHAVCGRFPKNQLLSEVMPA